MNILKRRRFFEAPFIFGPELILVKIQPVICKNYLKVSDTENHNVEKFPTNYAEKSMKSGKEIFSSIEVHEGNNFENEQCPICRRFYGLDYFDLHMILVHQIKKGQCNICLVKIANQELMEEHLKIVHDRKKKCPNCSKQFNENYLEKHMDSIHPRNPSSSIIYKCKVCQYQLG